MPLKVMKQPPARDCRAALSIWPPSAAVAVCGAALSGVPTPATDLITASNTSSMNILEGQNSMIFDAF